MTEMHDDERIYRDMVGHLTKEELRLVKKVMLAWADALDKCGESTNTKIVFATCVNTIGIMGPAYCQIAAATLLKRAAEHHLHPFTDANGPEVH